MLAQGLKLPVEGPHARCIYIRQNVMAVEFGGELVTKEAAQELDVVHQLGLWHGVQLVFLQQLAHEKLIDGHG